MAKIKNTKIEKMQETTKNISTQLENGLTR